MTHRLLNVLTALSLLLCMAATVLFVRGFVTSDLMGWVPERSDGGLYAVFLCSGRGGVGFSISSFPPGVIAERGWHWRHYEP